MKYENDIQFQKRNQAMKELWKLKKALELFEIHNRIHPKSDH